MAGALPGQAGGEGKVQATKPGDRRSESCSGKHNPKVAGSNPAPATLRSLVVRATRFFFRWVIRAQFDRVPAPAYNSQVVNGDVAQWQSKRLIIAGSSVRV